MAELGTQESFEEDNVAGIRRSCYAYAPTPSSCVFQSHYQQSPQTVNGTSGGETCRVRDDHYWPPPAQIRAGATNAYGSYLG